jgi:hypothetical protein
MHSLFMFLDLIVLIKKYIVHLIEIMIVCVVLSGALVYHLTSHGVAPTTAPLLRAVLLTCNVETRFKMSASGHI